ncbi:DUF1707 domain-containing protein [Streptomyces sp. BR123]|uniref:DUF1707 SHOCT-like domain-containing protein n=1 Tax=Streptomyces sp. BR123 TaxID=2749828 RepID=UPI0015C44F6F|nr:DUF1707 domain-containing protein [Streptomyces sp. BR123]NXY94647.1 DUF1707 domain-containing protein [Streptomyces sp. BR123]
MDENRSKPSAPVAPSAPAVRVSDADRDRALGILAAALAEGRLDAQEHASRVQAALRARTAGDLGTLTADLPAPTPTRAEQDRKDLAEWLAEWRYWLGGLVLMTAVWGVRCLQEGELTYYWPVAPLGVWAAVLVAVAIWPRQGDGDGKD